MPDARAWTLKCFRVPSPDYDPGYAAYRRCTGGMAIAEELLSLGYPVDAVRIFNELLADKEAHQAMQMYGGRPDVSVQLEFQLKRALTRIKPETLPDAVQALLTPRTEGKAGDVLDLVLVLQPCACRRPR